jgi:glutathione S-transferase
MSEQAYVLGYWDIRGLAAPIRMALVYGGLPWREELYSLERKPDGKWGSEWAARCRAMSDAGECAFPNLPYLVLPDGRVVVQSNAILRYIAKKVNLMGASDVEELLIDEAIEQVADMRTEMVRMSYGSKEEFDAKRQEFSKLSLGYYFSSFDRCLRQRGGEWMIGSGPTIADFVLVEALEVAQKMSEPYIDFTEQYQALSTLMQKVRSLKKLRPYFESDAAKFPFNNKVAAWGGAPQ